MAATPSSVLSLGFGAWGADELLPTLGYGIGAASSTAGAALQWTADPTEIEYTDDRTRLEWTL